MSRQTLEVFHGLMKKGWLGRQEDSVLFSLANDIDVREELGDFQSVLCFDLLWTGDRVYLIPKQENELFLKNNSDYRRDVGSETRNIDLCLLNYLSVYLLYLFFNGEGSTSLCRDFITKDELVCLFDEHCGFVTDSKANNGSLQEEYSEMFTRLATAWLGKTANDVNSTKLTDKYGVVNKILRKFKVDDVFYVDEDEKIKPTRKTKDLMPYFLGVGRVAEIQNWFKESFQDAANQ